MVLAFRPAHGSRLLEGWRPYPCAVDCEPGWRLGLRGKALDVERAGLRPAASVLRERGWPLWPLVTSGVAVGWPCACACVRVHAVRAGAGGGRGRAGRRWAQQLRFDLTAPRPHSEEIPFDCLCFRSLGSERSEAVPQGRLIPHFSIFAMKPKES